MLRNAWHGQVPCHFPSDEFLISKSCFGSLLSGTVVRFCRPPRRIMPATKTLDYSWRKVSESELLSIRCLPLLPRNRRWPCREARLFRDSYLSGLARAPNRLQRAESKHLLPHTGGLAIGGKTCLARVFVGSVARKAALWHQQDQTSPHDKGSSHRVAAVVQPAASSSAPPHALRPITSLTGSFNIEYRLCGRVRDPYLMKIVPSAIGFAASPKLAIVAGQYSAAQQLYRILISGPANQVRQI